MNESRTNDCTISVYTHRRTTTSVTSSATTITITMARRHALWVLDVLLLLSVNTFSFVHIPGRRVPCENHHNRKRFTVSFDATKAIYDQHQWWNKEQLMEFADSQGVELSLTTLGPGFRALVRSSHNTTLIMGYVEGFVRPSGKLMHLDKMEVFQKAVATAREENPKFKGGGNIMGVGLLMAYLCLWHGFEESGCTQAEFLAIDGKL